MIETAPLLPYVTSNLPGIGGTLRNSAEDFQVEEIPAYLPSGEGDHVFAWFEKRELTTAQVVRDIATALKIRDSDIGVAGMKDKFAITQQMISIPPPILPQTVLALELPGVSILSAKSHGHKLRTGHLKGNRFSLRVRELNCEADEARTRAQSILGMLSQVPGAPNWYGAQRFGRKGDNSEIGKALLKGLPCKGRTPRGRQRRLYVSAYQAHLFNRFLHERISDGLFSNVLLGEVLQKVDSGGMFISDNSDEDQRRFDAGELSITGPMFGYKMKSAAQGSPAESREQSQLRREELDLQSFKNLGKIATGTRRSLSVILRDATVDADRDCIQVHFSLPPGSYATAIMRELIKGPTNFPS